MVKRISSSEQLEAHKTKCIHVHRLVIGFPLVLFGRHVNRCPNERGHLKVVVFVLLGKGIQETSCAQVGYFDLEAVSIRDGQRVLTTHSDVHNKLSVLRSL